MGSGRGGNGTRAIEFRIVQDATIKLMYFFLAFCSVGKLELEIAHLPLHNWAFQSRGPQRLRLEFLVLGKGLPSNTEETLQAKKNDLISHLRKFISYTKSSTASHDNVDDSGYSSSLSRKLKVLVKIVHGISPKNLLYRHIMCFLLLTKSFGLVYDVL